MQVDKMFVDGRQWQHSEMWWPRLFCHHAAIQWDDYDKDYSDLPPQVSRAASYPIQSAPMLFCMLVSTKSAQLQAPRNAINFSAFVLCMTDCA